jgi:hypothetical protein
MSYLRTLHICPADIADTVGRHAVTWHWVTLPDGKVLLSTDFISDIEQETFEKHATVEPLPHIFDPSPIDQKHVDSLKHIGVKAGHTTKDVRKLAKEKLSRLL